MVSHRKCLASVWWFARWEVLFSAQTPTRKVTCSNSRGKMKLSSLKCGRQHRTKHRGNRQEEPREGGQPRDWSLGRGPPGGSSIMTVI